ncbi:MUS42 protein [Uncinocarpus reesii 1704]|uniref:DNA repair protein REV1 n=1 Tax=Uncinocarpus reesii (strain UAMH 1704) TaxID=336963 RepID=C4JFL4_UNCRE|nr:MUS42 protein [Uncinocarpus reesii 1704]EEP76179.1 MUS42 protein [Uncinocarpus reesii 1704]
MGSRLESGSNAVRKKIENHVFDGEDGEEYGASSFGGFGDYFRRKKLKLQNLDAEIRSSSPNNPPIFRGVVAHVNGYTQPSLSDLHRLIVSHGGGFLQYLDGKTAATHIIASSLTPKKREEFRNYRVVKPAWVVESINSGRLLPWDSFRVVSEAASQKVLQFHQDGRFTSQSRSQSSSYRDQMETSWYGSRLIQQGVDANTHEPNAAPTPEPKTAEEGDDLSNTADSVNEDKLYQVTDGSTLAEDTVIPDDFGQRTRQEPEPETIHDESRQQKSESRKEPTTSEEYNAQLLSAPHLRNSSVANPDFIKQYYRESRLHHLSTWKAELKAKLQEATLARASSRRTVKTNVPGARRYILHVDFDSFFAAVSLRKHPELVDKPVAIAHGTGGGSEIASCNYPARAFGIKNGMWMQGAMQMCPDLKVLPYDYAGYEDASRRFYEAILDIDGIVQSVSIDEALIDITRLCLDAASSDGKGISESSIWREQTKADEIAQGLRDSIKRKTGCDVSVGIGGNILQAKLALRKAKPAGQFQLKPDAVLDFIGEFTVQQLPGVAYSLGGKLEELGVKYVKDIRELSKERLIQSLGPKTGAKLWDYARGIDNAEVGDVAPRKSVSAEINWGIRFVTQAQAEEFVQSLCDELHRRLVENGVKGKQLTMRIMRRALDAPLEPPKHLGHGKCDTFNKSIMLGVATNASESLGREAISVLRGFNFSPGDLRGLGVQMTKLEPVKPDAAPGAQSSQRQLNFNASSPRKRPFTPDLDEITTPRKAESHIAIQTAPILNDELQKPLNITGTQFILPSQANSQVLAELPGDIRSKFVSMNKRQKLDKVENPPKSSSRPQTPLGLPPQSQLDPEALEALPEDVRTEILGYYQQSPQTPTRHGSPESSKIRPKTSLTPTKTRAGRGRGRQIGSKSGGNSSLTQSNFVVARPSSSTGAAVGESPGAPSFVEEYAEDNISEEFLSALPEDIRREVIEEHKRSRLQKRAGLNLPATRKSTSSKPTDRPPDQKVLEFPPQPPKPTFTSRKLSSLPELREALSEWYESFKTEGPFEEDVNALTRYLKRVVLEERDVSKAVAVTQWFGWLLDQDASDKDHALETVKLGSSGQQPLDAWISALQKIRSDVNDALGERGLPPVEFT